MPQTAALMAEFQGRMAHLPARAPEFDQLIEQIPPGMASDAGSVFSV
jgi:hypothetical protein